MRTLNSISVAKECRASKLLRRGLWLPAPDPMFVSMPEFQFHVPAPLAAPGAFYARAMTLSTHAAWFILTIRIMEPEPLSETFLLAWDIDVCGVLKSAQGKLESLLFVAPQRVGRKYRWVTKHITEIWEATDPTDESECVLMVAEDGQEHSGYFMERAKGVKRRQLIARTSGIAPKRRLDS